VGRARDAGAVDNAENRGVCAGAEGQRQNRHPFYSNRPVRSYSAHVRIYPGARATLAATMEMIRLHLASPPEDAETTPQFRTSDS
jgi:hypothetical protein